MKNNRTRRASGSRRDRRFVDRLEPRVLLSSYVVNTLSDAASPPPGTLTLRQAIIDADATAGASLITFSPTVFPAGSLHVIKLTQGQLLLSNTTGKMTIQGPGSSVVQINAQGASRVIEIDPGVTAAISGVSVTGGVAPSNGISEGGGIDCEGSLTLSESTVSGNVAGVGSAQLYTTALGAGIYSSGPLVVQNCVITGNTATGYGTTGFVARGGGVYANSTLILSGSTVSGNEAHGSDAGGNPLSGTDGSGGGIYAAQKLTVSNSVFSGDSAVGGDGFSSPQTSGAGAGGAIDALNGATISGSSFSGNMAVGGTTPYGSNGGAAGGAIASAKSLVVSGCTLTGNMAQSGNTQAAGVNADAFGGAIDGLASVTIQQSAISGNSAVGGMGQYSYLSGAVAYGGGVAAAGPLNVVQSTLSGNHAVGGAGNPGNFGPDMHPGNGGYAYGGGIFSSAAVTLTDSTLANNAATGGAGGNATLGPGNGGDGGKAFGGAVADTSSFLVDDCTISGNAAVGGAGGMGYNDGIGHVRAPGSAGTGVGGGVSIPFSTRTANNSILSGNTATTSQADIAGALSASSFNNLIGVGGGLTNGAHGNKVGITNPKLSTLANHGGPTPTEVPLPGSPAIDAGANAVVPAGISVDQRGYPRILNGVVDIGAAEYNTLTLSGSVFNDINGDGIRQSSEPGLGSWQVFLDVQNVGFYINGDPVATTNSAGNYSLSFPVTNGNPLIIREVRQTNWRRTDPAGLYPLGYYTLKPTSKLNYANITFGDSLTNLVLGTVFDDKNANGKQDAGEAGLAGWTVELDQYVGGKWKTNIASATTNASGAYQFILASGMYRLHDVIKSPYKATIPVNGVLSLTLTTGQTATGENFGNK